MTTLVEFEEGGKPRLRKCRVYWMGIWTTAWQCVGFVRGDIWSATGTTPKDAYDQFMKENHMRRPILQKLRDWINHA